MVNGNVGGIVSWYVELYVGGIVVRSGADGSVSEDEGGSVSGGRALEMSSPACVDAQSG